MIGSPVFRAMFTRNFKEAETSEVNLPDKKAETVELMLDFLYPDKDPLGLFVGIYGLYAPGPGYSSSFGTNVYLLLLANCDKLCFRSKAFSSSKVIPFRLKYYPGPGF